MPPSGFPILFITASRIGDAVLSSGLLAKLVSETPNARVTVAAGPASAPLFRDTPGLERLIVLEKEPFAGHWIKLWRRVRKTRWGVVVDLRGSRLSSFLKRRRRAVFAPASGLVEPEHKVVEAARLLGLQDDPPAPFLFTSAETEAAAQALFDGIEGEGPVLALAPGATWRGKAWPSDRFARLALRLRGPGEPFEHGRVVIVGGPEDRVAAEAIRRALPRGAVTDLTGKADLLTIHALLKRVRLFVGNDSGLAHLSAAAGAPTLALFGPSDERRYAPWGPKARVVRGPRPFEAFKAIDPELNQSVQHMLDLKVPSVLAAAKTLLSETETVLRQAQDGGEDG